MSVDTILAGRQICRDLRDAVPALATALEMRTAAEKAYKVAQATAYLNAEGTVPEREARATLATAELWEAAEVGENAVRVQVKHLDSLFARLDWARSELAKESRIAAVTA